MSELKMISEFKMSDYFDKPVEFVGDTIECPDFAYATTTCEWEVNGIDYGHAIAHAINHHDKLVEENQHLTAIATKHATRADELYEALESTNKELYFLINELNKYRTKDISCDQLDPPELHDMETCHLNAILLDKSRIEAEKGDGICN